MMHQAECVQSLQQRFQQRRQRQLSQPVMPLSLSSPIILLLLLMLIMPAWLPVLLGNGQFASASDSRIIGSSGVDVSGGESNSRGASDVAASGEWGASRKGGSSRASFGRGEAGWSIGRDKSESESGGRGSNLSAEARSVFDDDDDDNENEGGHHQIDGDERRASAVKTTSRAPCRKQAEPASVASAAADTSDERARAGNGAKQRNRHPSTMIAMEANHNDSASLGARNRLPTKAAGLPSPSRSLNKREAGCRGYLQSCSIQIAYPCCTGLHCVSQRCDWMPSERARIVSARQRTDSIGYPWRSSYNYAMRFPPLQPVFTEI